VSKVWSLAGSGLKKKKQQKETTGRAKRRARYEASTNTRAKRTAKSNDEKVIPPFANVFDARKRSRDTKRSRFPPKNVATQEERKYKKKTKKKKKKKKKRKKGTHAMAISSASFSIAACAVLFDRCRADIVTFSLCV